MPDGQGRRVQSALSAHQSCRYEDARRSGEFVGCWLGQLFNGIGVAWISLLAALGLALSFGLMRVIRMAHGEILMMGGLSRLTFPLKIFPHVIAYPLGMIVAFVGTALFGGFLERTLIRRLYGRPLDTLLATWARTV